MYEEADIDGHSLQLSYDLGEQGFLGDVQIKSITAYREMTWDDLLDIDGSPIDAFHSGRGIEYDQTSQELQILGSTDRVNYVLGYYYFDETADVLNPITFFGVFGGRPRRTPTGSTASRMRCSGSSTGSPARKCCRTA